MVAHIQIDDRALQALKKRLAQFNAAKVEVGILAAHGGALKPPGGDLTLAEIGLLHEYGDPASGLPERSFIRKTALDQAKKIADFEAKLMTLVIDGKLTPMRGLALLGAMMAAEVKKTITGGRVGGPPLAPSTIAAKGSSKPLIDTGTLVGAINFEVTV